MKIEGNDIKVGNILRHKNGLWKVTKTEHVKPGKGGAYMQVEMKDVRVGTKLNERFRSSETVERVQLEDETYQYLYPEGDRLVLMNQNTYEQLSVPGALLGESKAFLQENMIVTVRLFEGKPLDVMLPATVVLEIVEADPVVKGQTASASFKPAVLENGAKIMVPPHVESGTRVVVDTKECAYVERAK
jgi:elongation factor P